jgi:aquaporin Z
MPENGAPPLVVHDPQRANHMLMLEFGDRKDFDDPKLEYRRLFSELLGTFFLVLVAAGGGILHAKGQISLAAAVVAPGLMVMGIILFMGGISGAHLNPGVSLAFAVRGDFPWKRVPGYIIVQLVGATLACLFLLAVLATSSTSARRSRGRVTRTGRRS